jgi:hypothetical protein
VQLLTGGNDAADKKTVDVEARDPRKRLIR